MPITLDELDRQLASRKFAPVYFLHGEEEFLVDECADRIVSAAVDPATKSFNFDVLYGTEAKGDDVVTMANAFPMMAERRVIVVREFERMSGKEPGKDKDADGVPFLRYLKTPSPTTVLVLVAGEPDLRKTPYPLLTKSAVTIAFKRMYERDLVKWIDDRVKRRKGKIAPEAARLLLASAGTDLRTLHNEIEKLFVATDGSAISVDDVRRVAGMSGESTVFDLQKAIAAKRGSDALRILHRMLVSERPATIIVMLARFFQQIHTARHLMRVGTTDKGAIAAALKTSPYFVDEYIAIARGYAPPDLERAFAALRDTDTLLKTSGIDDEVAMGRLVVALSGRTP